MLKEARRTGQPVLVTLRGAPLARVEPIPEPGEPRPLGALRGSIRVRGDIVHTDFEADWDMEP